MACSSSLRLGCVRDSRFLEQINIHAICQRRSSSSAPARYTGSGEVAVGAPAADSAEGLGGGFLAHGILKTRGVKESTQICQHRKENQTDTILCVGKETWGEWISNPALAPALAPAPIVQLSPQYHPAESLGHWE